MLSAVQMALFYLHVPSKQSLPRCGNTCYHFDNRREIISPSYKSQITEGSCSLCFFIILLKTGILAQDRNFSARQEFIKFPGWAMVSKERWSNERGRSWSCGWLVQGEPTCSEVNYSTARSCLKLQCCEHTGQSIPIRFSLLATHLGCCKRRQDC